MINFKELITEARKKSETINSAFAEIKRWRGNSLDDVYGWSEVDFADRFGLNTADATKLHDKVMHEIFGQVRYWNAKNPSRKPLSPEKEKELKALSK